MTNAHPANRLATARSPYLRQHAHNPVDWYEWGDAAFARAKAEDKPVMLSIGYSACHWCHVMAHESFEDDETAALLNANFISIKVDREEWPQVDQLYQGVVQLMRRGGGWPLTVFLLPDRRPFYGGTYFPKEERYGMPSFRRLLHALNHAWKHERAELEAHAGEFVEGLGQLATHALRPGQESLGAADVVDAANELASVCDPVHGGFGEGGPKFPNPMNVALMLRGYRRSGEPRVRDLVLLTLDQMARGGVYDQLGGGFHRYSVDGHWAVPHFEKMLYDNAQLLHLYAEGFLISKSPLYQRVVEETVAYLAREMTSPDGTFFTAQDADSEGEEGRFFAWTPPQFVEALGEAEGTAAAAFFGVTASGNFEHGATVLSAREVEPAPETLRRWKQSLREVRQKRVAPGLDDKVLVGWNGLLIRGLAFAGRVFARPDWVAMASRAAGRLVELAVAPDGSVARSVDQGAPRLNGVLEDAGGLAVGLTALYQSTFEPRWLEVAQNVCARARTRFWDARANAWRTAALDDADAVVPQYSLHDNAMPSGAAMLTEAQLALAALTSDAEGLQTAAAYVSRMAAAMRENPMGFGHLWLVADALVDGAASVLLDGDASVVRGLVDEVSSTWLPTMHLARGPGTGERALEQPFDGRAARAFVCRDFACGLPVTSVEELRGELSRFTSAARQSSEP